MHDANELARMIASYRFLSGELKEASGSQRLHRPRIAEAVEETFLAIIRHRAADPRISVKQIEFLLSVLVEARGDAGLRRLIRDEAMVHVRLLADRIDASGKTSPQPLPYATADEQPRSEADLHS